MSYLIPGELIPEDGFIELNKGREVTTLKVANISDRPIQMALIIISLNLIKV